MVEDFSPICCLFLNINFQGGWCVVGNKPKLWHENFFVIHTKNAHKVIACKWLLHNCNNRKHCKLSSMYCVCCYKLCCFDGGPFIFFLFFFVTFHCNFISLCSIILYYHQKKSVSKRVFFCFFTKLFLLWLPFLTIFPNKKTPTIEYHGKLGEGDETCAFIMEGFYFEYFVDFKFEMNFPLFSISKD